MRRWRRIAAVALVLVVVGSMATTAVPTRTTHRMALAETDETLSGTLLNADGEPLAGAEVAAVSYDPFTVETNRTDERGNYEFSLPNGTYDVTALPLETGDGTVDAWTRTVVVDGTTDEGELRLPRGHNLTIDVVDGNGASVNAYAFVPNHDPSGWMYEYASGEDLDNPSNWNNVATREVENGTFEYRVFDSWTHDLLGVGTASVDGADRTVSAAVDRYNGTDISRAAGVSVVRDLETNRSGQSVAEFLASETAGQRINVRLFVSNASAGDSLIVEESLPDGYRYVDGSAVGADVDASDDILRFGVSGDAGEVRYQIEATDGGRTYAQFDGAVSGDASGPVLGEDRIDGRTPALGLTVDAETDTRVGPNNTVEITASVDDERPNRATVTIERSATGAVVHRETVRTDGGTTARTIEWDATDGAGAPVPSGDYTVRLASETDVGPTVEKTASVTVDTVAPTVEVTGLGPSGSSTEAPDGQAIRVSDTLGVNATAGGTPGEAAAVFVNLVAEFANFETTIKPTKNGDGTWSIPYPLFEVPDDGNYSVEALAIDGALNANATAVDATVVLDRRGPELGVTVDRVNATEARVVVAPDEPLVEPPEVTVRKPNGENATVATTANGSVWDGTFALRDDGQYDVTATGRDRAGNLGEGTATTVLRNLSTENRTVTVKLEPSGLFVTFRTENEVADGFVAISESSTPLAPLAPGNAGVSFLDAKLGERLDENLSAATIGIPVDGATLPPSVDPDEVTIRHYDEDAGAWARVGTEIRSVELDDGTNGTYWVAEVDGFSTYGAMADDREGPTVTTSSPSGTLAAGTTEATVRFEYEDALSGVNASSVRLSFDGTDVTDRESTRVTSGAASFRATDLEPGEHRATLVVEDDAGTTTMAARAFTIADSASEPTPAPVTPTPEEEEDRAAPSGGGGGGGNVPPPSILSAVEPADEGVRLTVRNARSGAETDVDLPDVGIGVVAFTGLDLSFAGDDPKFELGIAPRPTPPEGVPSLDGATALSYLTVEPDGLRDGGLETATFEFGVDAATLPTGSTLDDVVLYRYRADAGEWRALDTARVDGAFTATSPGFSAFAVGVAPDADETETPAATDVATERPTDERTATDGRTATPGRTPTEGQHGYGFLAALFALLAGATLRRR